MKKNAKVLKTESNTRINIPKAWADYIGLENKEIVTLELKGKKIIISKVEAK